MFVCASVCVFPVGGLFLKHNTITLTFITGWLKPRFAAALCFCVWWIFNIFTPQKQKERTNTHSAAPQHSGSRVLSTNTQFSYFIPEPLILFINTTSSLRLITSEPCLCVFVWYEKCVCVDKWFAAGWVTACSTHSRTSGTFRRIGVKQDFSDLTLSEAWRFPRCLLTAGRRTVVVILTSLFCLWNFDLMCQLRTWGKLHFGVRETSSWFCIYRHL